MHTEVAECSGRGSLDRRVAIAAIDASSPTLMFVAELDRLLAGMTHWPVFQEERLDLSAHLEGG